MEEEMSRTNTTVIPSAVLSVWLCFLLVASGASAGQYARISDDLQLYYVDAGQGSPMVFIPGWTTSEVVFDKQIAHFAKTHRVIAYDPRSQGLSTRTLDNNTYAQHGRDLAGLIDRLVLKRVTLVAWSAGCFDAYAYIRSIGIDNLTALVCIDNPPQGLSAQPGDWAMADASEKGLAEVSGVREMIVGKRRALTEGMFKFMNGRDVTPEESDWFARQAMLSPDYAVLLLQSDFLFSDYRPEAKAIDGKLPVLFAISEPNSGAALPWIKANMPHAETFGIKRHMSLWSEPDSFNAAVDDFLAKVK
jgi:non-heme chloroperoxidase